MSVQLNAVLRLLPTLRPEELVELRSKVSASISLSGSPPSTGGGAASDFLLDGIIYELQRRGAIGRNTFAVRRAATGKYKDEAAAIAATLNEHYPGLSSLELITAGRVIARALANFLQNANIPVTVNTMVNNAGKGITALDESFPDYFESGLLTSIWRK
jgi:hypothetical protein